MSNHLASHPAPEAFSLRLSDDQRSMLEPLRRYAREQLQPLLNDTVTESRRREAMQTAAQLGLASAMLSERQGGLGISAFELCLLLEELASGPLHLAAELSVSAPALAVSRYQEWLIRLLPTDTETLFNGEHPLALAIAAPEQEASFALLPRQGQGLLVLAPEDAGRWRLRWLDPEALQRLLPTGHGASSAQGLRLVRLPPAADIHGTGFSTTLQPGVCRSIMIWQGLWLAGLLAGAARAATSFAFSYAQTRVAFHRPIIHHQAVALRLADMAIATDALRLQVWATAARFGGASLLPPGQFAAMAQHVVGTSLEIHRHAVQVCGGHGYVEGFPPSRRFQDARVLSLVLLELAQTLAHEEAAPGAQSMAASERGDKQAQGQP